ncbi:hypothetical protein PO909_015553 [Leuciscus waleckii]
MLQASAVVVWEWLSEHGRWRPYSPTVSHHIEEVIRSDPRGGSIVLGRADSRLSPYIIDLHSMHQFRQDTGTLRPVRRSFYDPTSAPGQGWIWEWENDAGSWTAFDMEVSIALQAARDRQQPWLDLTSLGFCYFVDFQTMTQINRQTQRQRRIQRRSDMVYPLVTGPLPKNSLAWGGGSTGALLGVGVSGSTLSRKGSAVYPSGTLSVSSLAPLGQPCACQQCMLVLSVKANGTASQTLGRATKPNSPKASFGTLPSYVLNSYSHTLPHGTSLKSMPSEEAKNSAVFDQSLSLLTSATANLSISSSRPTPSSLPPTLPSQNQQPPSAQSLSSSATFVPTAILVNTSTSPTPSTVFTSSSTTLASQRSAACAAPIPPRASLAGLSRPALQRIAMAQSRALIASG